MITNRELAIFERKIIYLDKLLMNKQPDHDQISKLLYKIRQKVLIFEIELNQLELNSQNDNKKTDTRVLFIKKRLEIIVNNLQLVDDYNSKILQNNQKKSIDTLTIVNTVFLPLALITSYFGMNFKSMGCPSTSSGIFTIKYGQVLVFILFIIISSVIISLFKNNLIPG